MKNTYQTHNDRMAKLPALQICDSRIEITNLRGLQSKICEVLESKIPTDYQRRRLKEAYHALDKADDELSRFALSLHADAQGYSVER